MRTGGSQSGRIGVMRDGWKRCSAGASVNSPDAENFYENEFSANSLVFSLENLPDLLRKFAAFGEIFEIDGDLANKKIRFEMTDKKIDVYLPNSVRVAMDDI